MTSISELEKTIQNLTKQQKRYKEELVKLLNDSRDFITEKERRNDYISSLLEQLKALSSPQKTSDSIENVMDAEIVEVACCIIKLQLRLIQVLFSPNLEAIIKGPVGAKRFLVLEKATRLEAAEIEVATASLLQTWIIYLALLPLSVFRSQSSEKFKKFLEQFKKYRQVITDPKEKAAINKNLYLLSLAFEHAYILTTTSNGQQLQLAMQLAESLKEERPNFLPNTIPFDKTIYTRIPELILQMWQALANQDSFTKINAFVQAATDDTLDENITSASVSIIADLLKSFLNLLKADFGALASYAFMDTVENFNWIADSLAGSTIDLLISLTGSSANLDLFATWQQLYNNKTLSSMKPEDIIEFCKKHPEYAGAMYFKFPKESFKELSWIIEHFPEMTISSKEDTKSTMKIFFDENGDFYFQWALMAFNSEYLRAFKRLVRYIIESFEGLYQMLMDIRASLIETPTLSSILSTILQPTLNTLTALSFVAVQEPVFSWAHNFYNDYSQARYILLSSGQGIFPFFSPSSGDKKAEIINNEIESLLVKHIDKSLLTFAKIPLAQSIWTHGIGCYPETNITIQDLINFINEKPNEEIPSLMSLTPEEKKEPSPENFDPDARLLGITMRLWLANVVKTSEELVALRLGTFLIFPSIRQKVIETLKQVAYNAQNLARPSYKDVEKMLNNYKENIEKQLEEDLYETFTVFQASVAASWSTQVNELLEKYEDIIVNGIVKNLLKNFRTVLTILQLEKMRDHITKGDIELAKKIFTHDAFWNAKEQIKAALTGKQFEQTRMALDTIEEEQIINIISVLEEGNNDQLATLFAELATATPPHYLTNIVVSITLWDMIDQILPEPSSHSIKTSKNSMCKCIEKAGFFGTIIKTINDWMAAIENIPEIIVGATDELVKILFETLLEIQTAFSWPASIPHQSPGAVKSFENFVDAIERIIDLVFGIIINPASIAILDTWIYGWILGILQGIETCLIKRS